MSAMTGQLARLSWSSSLWFLCDNFLPPNGFQTVCAHRTEVCPATLGYPTQIDDRPLSSLDASTGQTKVCESVAVKVAHTFLELVPPPLVVHGFVRPLCPSCALSASECPQQRVIPAQRPSFLSLEACPRHPGGVARQSVQHSSLQSSIRSRASLKTDPCAAWITAIVFNASLSPESSVCCPVECSIEHSHDVHFSMS